jgi:hypothetical protein
MFGSNFQRQFVAALAAFLVSTVAVGAAVGPATVTTASVSA